MLTGHDLATILSPAPRGIQALVCRAGEVVGTAPSRGGLHRRLRYPRIGSPSHGGSLAAIAVERAVADDPALVG
jgi:hypothetical protein